ncbi:hypothetical protein RUMHYD_01900 [Blautia hydrogenotrophica DSM 10507]|uniref:Uncharacterized protein n=1 Tax=Blautia hydrogenotrophica (strain DSM 10507 / JCM 14656 / S5a33) TaxID=476272 RepID=C0CM25_BLAHS|nr:hypothetical protein RUMHYD_01900 [Blautia hydrogenotrophica DSM 10507]
MKNIHLIKILENLLKIHQNLTADIKPDTSGPLMQPKLVASLEKCRAEEQTKKPLNGLSS